MMMSRLGLRCHAFSTATTPSSSSNTSASGYAFKKTQVHVLLFENVKGFGSAGEIVMVDREFIALFPKRKKKEKKEEEQLKPCKKNE